MNIERKDDGVDVSFGKLETSLITISYLFFAGHFLYQLVV